MKVNMEVYELRDNYNRNNPNGHFFDKKTLSFFGERFSEMRVLKNTEKIVCGGIEHECYVLSSYQRKHPMGARRKYHYFEVGTFKYIYT